MEVRLGHLRLGPAPEHQVLAGWRSSHSSLPHRPVLWSLGVRERVGGAGHSSHCGQVLFPESQDHPSVLLVKIHLPPYTSICKSNFKEKATLAWVPTVVQKTG
jgi:hypothetical protein